MQVETTIENVRAEIVELHDFFVAWFTGKLPKNTESFARIESALGAEFLIISPAGVATARKALLAQLYQAHGRIPNIRIWIKNVQLRQRHGPIQIVTYEEWQESDGETGRETTARLSSVIFHQKKDAPNHLEWLHLHETWRPL